MSETHKRTGRRRRLVWLTTACLLLVVVWPGGWAYYRYRSNTELSRLLGRARYGGTVQTHNLDDSVYRRLVVLSDTRFGPLSAIGTWLRDVWFIIGEPKSIKIAGIGCPPAEILHRIAGMERLESVSIYACGEIDEELRHLTSCDGLTILRLSRVSLQPGAIRAIAACERLEELDLSRSAGVDDATMAELANLTTLRVLRISQTEITDAGIERLTDLDRLEDLRVAGTAITDASVPALIRIAPKQLDVEGTDLSAESVARLRAVLPTANVRADF